MNFAKPASAKCLAASKGQSRWEALFRDRATIRILVANVGGLSILAAISSLRASGADDVTYELSLVILGLVLYCYSKVTEKPMSKGKEPKRTLPNSKRIWISQDREHSTREPRGLREPLAKPARMPRQAPSFKGVGWEAEVSELLQQVSAAGSTDSVLLALTQATTACIKPILPEAKISSFTTVNLVNNRDVASLEADVTIELEPAILAPRIEAFGLKKMGQRPANDCQVADRKSAVGLSDDELAKMTLRLLTKELEKDGFYNYHRCSYKEREPKVVFKVPASRGITDRDIFVTFTVNSPTPARLATLGQQLALFNPKALELGLLARRWARDRGIAYAAKGGLSPYAWTCLAGYYLQQSNSDTAEKSTFGLDHSELARGDGASCGTIVELFQGFLHFYASFDWRAGVVSLRLGRQIAWADSSLESTVDSRQLGIEDPFDPRRDLANTVTSETFQRLLDELTRARGLLDGRCAGFKELLEAWIAPKEAA